MSMRPLALFPLVLFGCQSSAPPPVEHAAAPAPAAVAIAEPAVAPAPAKDPAPPPFRLPGDVRPRRYGLELTIAPDQERFDGVVRIDAEVVKPTRVVWLNATGLTIARATVAGRAARVVPGGDDFVGLAVDDELARGPVAIEVAYQAPIDRERSRGVYAEKEGADWYAYTFLEAIDARRAFPCFDEPAYKVPWQLTFHVRKDHVALANAAVTSESDEGGGMKKVVLAESKPLPSYLVAFVVGPFELVDGGTAGRVETPIRFIVPRGRGKETRWAREITPKVVTALEDYFDMAYPYGKLDVAVVPRYWGTMEHPGIVAMGQPLTLIPPDRETRGRRQHYANILAHELAHYWFGDLVTMAWWDDTWLNEALGEWLDAKITHAVMPAWQFRDDSVHRGAEAMGADELLSNRMIRQTVDSKEGIQASFDNSITYFKGAHVLNMFEHWVGEARFQAFIRAYIRKHAWGNASAGDFVAAMSAELGGDVSSAFRTFLEQPGAPLIQHEVSCAGGSPILHLRQRRSLPAGVVDPQPKIWQVPVCIRHGDGKETQRECTLLTAAEADLPLDGACPTWLVMNADGDGYYRAAYSAAELTALLVRKPANGRAAALPLTRRERLQLLHDLSGALDRAEVTVGEGLALVPALIADGDERFVGAAGGVAGRINPQHLDDDLYARAQRFALATFGARARKLGWTRGPADSDDRHHLRLALVPMVAASGDARLAREARKLAEAWLRDRKAVDDELVGGVLFVSARDGDRALFDAFLAAARKPADRREQNRLVATLGGFRAPDLAAAARELILGGEFDLRESESILFRQLFSRENRDAAWAYAKEHLDVLLGKMRDDEGSGFLAGLAYAFCDKAHRDEAAALLAPRAAKIDGARNALSQALESVDRCIAIRERELPAVREFLQRY